MASGRRRPAGRAGRCVGRHHQTARRRATRTSRRRHAGRAPRPGRDARGGGPLDDSGVVSLDRVAPDTVELRLAVTHTGQSGSPALDIAQRFSADRPDRGTLAEVYLADLSHEHKFFVLRDGANAPLGSRDLTPLAAGERRYPLGALSRPGRRGRRGGRSRAPRRTDAECPRRAEVVPSLTAFVIRPSAFGRSKAQGPRPSVLREPSLVPCPYQAEAMALIETRDLWKTYVMGGGDPRPAWRLHRDSARRVRGHHGAVRLGQVDLDEPHRVSRHAEQGHLPPERPGGQPDGRRRTGADPERGDRVRVPDVQPARPSDGAPQRRAAAGLRGCEFLVRPSGRRRPSTRWSSNPHGPPAQRALGRPAPAGRDRARAGDKPSHPPGRRADGQPRLDDQRGDHGPVRSAPPGRQHDCPRHSRVRRRCPCPPRDPHPRRPGARRTSRAQPDALPSRPCRPRGGGPCPARPVAALLRRLPRLHSPRLRPRRSR